MTGTSAADIRRRNLFEVLRLVHVLAPVSRQELTDELGLSLATVASIVRELLNTGVLEQVARDRTRLGRPVSRVQLAPDRGRFIGVATAETYVQVDLYDAALGRLRMVRRPYGDGDQTPAEVVDHICRTMDEALQPCSLAVADLLGVGVSVPGQVDLHGAASVSAPNWAWHDVPLGVMLRERIFAPLYLDNPLKTTTTAQLWSTPTRSTGDLAVVVMGTGVGVGVATGDVLYRGVSNTAGEWGHTSVRPGGRQCRCGGRGCIEAYIGAPGIIATLQDLDRDSRLVVHGDQTATIQALVEADEAGDPIAHRVAAHTAGYLGIGLANLVNMFNPSRIVLAGWLNELWGRSLLELAQPALRVQALAASLAAVRIEVPAVVRDDAAGFGAAAQALQESLWHRPDR